MRVGSSHAMMALFLSVFLTLSIFVAPLHGAELVGRVVGVHDGDTITLLDSNKFIYKVRLSGIDAPEIGQPFGKSSKESLSALAFNRSVIVDWSKQDRYGRIVGKIFADGRDLNLEQVKAGLAWWYRAYSKEQSLADQISYEQAENAAQASKRGLWRDSSPVSPWEWRRLRKTN